MKNDAFQKKFWSKVVEKKDIMAEEARTIMHLKDFSSRWDARANDTITDCVPYF